MIERVGLGGGCHWCTEAVFQAIGGVRHVAQGFIGALPPDDALSEAVVVDFDTRQVALADLVAAHLATHSARSAHHLRGKYRSAVYVTDDGQAARARAALAAHADPTLPPLVTRVLRLGVFQPSPPQFRDYYRTDPGRPFCVRYIAPKLDRLRADLPHLPHLPHLPGRT